MKREFKPGDTITFAGEDFEVLENHGDSGEVETKHGTVINPFYWKFYGEDCELKESVEEKYEKAFKEIKKLENRLRKLKRNFNSIKNNPYIIIDGKLGRRDGQYEI